MFEEEEKIEKMIVNQGKQYKNLIDESNLKKLINIATILSISMIAFYSLGALKHWKDISK